MKVRLPKLTLQSLLIAMIGLVALIGGAIAASLTAVTITKPLVIEINVQEPSLQATDIQFNFNATSMRYDSVDITIERIGGGLYSAEVTVTLVDAANATVASGSVTVSNYSSGSTVTIVLSWESGKTVTDVAGGTIVIEQLA